MDITRTLDILHLLKAPIFEIFVYSYHNDFTVTQTLQLDTRRIAFMPFLHTATEKFTMKFIRPCSLTRQKPLLWFILVSLIIRFLIILLRN